MRHDLLGAELKVFHLVEHGIENDVLCARVNDLLNFFGALIAASPDRNPWTEIGVFVAPTEPLPQTSLGSSFVAVNREIDPLGDAKRCRIALGLLNKAPYHR